METESSSARHYAITISPEGHDLLVTYRHSIDRDGTQYVQFCVRVPRPEPLDVAAIERVALETLADWVRAMAARPGAA